MLPLRYGLRWRVASMLLLLLVLAGALMPVVWLWPDRVSVRLWFDGIDKWAHGLTFAFLAVWFSGLYAKRAYWRIALGLFAFGLAIEVVQRVVGYRTADHQDLIANTVGILVGLLVGLIWAGGWSVAFERRLLRNDTHSG